MRKYMILPNAAVLACAVILFHKSFLAGHITWIGSLVTLAALLPLLYCLIGRMPRLLRYCAALLNAILFFNCGYASAGTVHMLAAGGMLDRRFFLIAGALWVCALGMTFIKATGANRFCAAAVNAVLCVAGGLGLYVRSALPWQPWMTAVVFAAFIAVAGLNVCLLTHLFSFRKGGEEVKRTDFPVDEAGESGMI